jgi:hypothetical protein
LFEIKKFRKIKTDQKLRVCRDRDGVDCGAVAHVNGLGLFSAARKPCQLLTGVQVPHYQSGILRSGKDELCVGTERQAGQRLLVAFVVTENPKRTEQQK